MAFKILTKDGRKVDPDDGKKIKEWLDDVLNRVLNNNPYFIGVEESLFSGDKYAIYKIENGESKKITEDFDWIYANEFLDGESPYIIAVKDGKESMYKIENDSVIKITPDFDFINANKFFEGKSNRFKVIDGEREMIFEFKDGQVTKIPNKERFKSDFYIMKERFGKESIYYEDENGKLQRITDKFDGIYSPLMNKQIGDIKFEVSVLGLPGEKENYFIGRKGNKEAIYKIENGEVKKITKDFDHIDRSSFNAFVNGLTNDIYIYVYLDGNEVKKVHFKLENDKLVKEPNQDTDFFIKKERFGKQAIYHMDENGDLHKISNNFDFILKDGFFYGKSPYFIARKDGKEAIYKIENGEVKKITPDFDVISANNLLEGKSNCFVAYQNGKVMAFEINNDKVKKISNFSVEEKKTLLGFSSEYVLYEENNGQKRKIAVFDNVGASGLINGITDTLIGRRDGKDAIYKVDNGQLIRVSPEFDKIIGIEFEEGKSNFFIGQINGKEAIYKYDGNGKIEKITPDFNWIKEGVLLSNESNFFIAERRDISMLFKYENGQLVKLIEGDAIMADDFLSGKSNTFQVEKNGKLETYKYENGEIMKVENEMEQNKDVEKSTNKEINNERRNKPMYEIDSGFGMSL